MEKAVDIARSICQTYEQIFKKSPDETKLHILLYLSQRECIALRGEPLFDEAFVKGPSGPVCVSLKDQLFEGTIAEVSACRISDPASYIIRNIIRQYGELSSEKLTELIQPEISRRNAGEDLSLKDPGTSLITLADIATDAQNVRIYDSIWDMYIDEFEDVEEFF